MQPATGATAVSYLSGLRNTMELFAFVTSFSFRWTLSSQLHATDEDDVMRVLLAGWCTHVASNTPLTSPQFAAATRMLIRLAGPDKSPLDTTDVAVLLEPCRVPVLLFAPPCGHEAGLTGEWIEYQRQNHMGAWRPADELRAHGLPLRPSHLHILDDSCAALNAILEQRARRLSRLADLYQRWYRRL